MFHRTLTISALLLLTAASMLAAADNSTSDYNPEYLHFMFRHETKEVLSGMDVADLKGDGRGEILYVDSQEGAVFALDGAGKQLWGKSLAGYVFDVKAADINGDGMKEVLVGSGSDVSVFGANGENGKKYLTGMGNQVHDIQVADLNSDGKVDIIASTYTKTESGASQCEPGIVFAFDGADNAASKRLWSYTLKGKDYPLAVISADLEGDGKTEVVVGSMKRTSDTSKKECKDALDQPAALVVINGDGTVRWNATTLGGVVSLYAADINGDGKKEIMVGSYPFLTVYSSTGDVLWSREGVTYISDTVAYDLNGDGKSEVLAASKDVNVYNVDSTPMWSGKTENRVYTLAVADLHGSGYGDVLAGSNRLYVFSRDGTLMWKGDDMRTIDFLNVFDLDGDGHPEVIVGGIKNISVYGSGVLIERESAADFYHKAELLYQDNNFTGAYEQLLLAEEKYLALKDRDSIVKVADLKKLVQSKLGQVASLKIEGDELVRKSKEAYLTGDFVQAIRYAAQAREKYATPDYRDDAGVANSTRLRASAEEALRLNASESMTIAENFLANKSYQLAYESASDAYDAYNFLNEKEGLAVADALVKKVLSEGGRAVDTSMREGRNSENSTVDAASLRLRLDAIKARAEALDPVTVAVVLAFAVFLTGFLSIVAFNLRWFLSNRKKKQLRTKETAARVAAIKAAADGNIPVEEASYQPGIRPFSEHHDGVRLPTKRFRR
ncbi:Repeat domain in Vibrio, Colwellia, Bradyrhizobium and Shewanella [uncultured archaeon]|nr:Repeat domain in Vibrio, Colwellia, Bradyrhizobium and Shewanella [uncultured archaeon]